MTTAVLSMRLVCRMAGVAGATALALGGPIAMATPQAAGGDGPTWKGAPEAKALVALKGASPVWSSPGLDGAGSMPIGNGRVGANVWVEASGDLVLLLSHTDAYSECERLLKLGRVRVTCEPPLEVAKQYSQRLDLERGVLVISTPGCTMEVMVDAGADVVLVRTESEVARRVTARLEVWRDGEKSLTGREQNSSWLMHEAPAGVDVMESADVVVEDARGWGGSGGGDAGGGGGVVWYHRNETSMVGFTVEHQGLLAVKDAVRDPLINRTFGGRLDGEGFVRVDAKTMTTVKAEREAVVRVVAVCAQSDDVGQWMGKLNQASAVAAPFAKAAERTAAAWRKRWTDSFVFVEPGEVAWGGAAVFGGAHPVRVGVDSNGQNRFGGKIRAAVMVDRALPPGEIETIAKGAGAGTVAGALAGAVTLPAEVGMSMAVPDGFKGAGDFSIVAWVTPAGEKVTGRIIDALTAGQSDGMLFDLQGGRVRAIVRNSTVQTEAAPGAGRESCVVMTFAGKEGSARVYLDGKLVSNGESGGRAASVSEAYALQRFVVTAATKGEFPVKFNGSIFTVSPRHVDGAAFNEDFRNWGGSFWWQNTRLPYHGMLARGDGDLMASLFDFYALTLPACKARAKLYYKAEGAYFPETMTTFGTYANADYGWNRQGMAVSDVGCAYWRWAWNQGPELAAMMLDHWDYTGDRKRLTEQTIPMAREVLKYFDSRFERDAKGTLLITPTQAIETYWAGVVNDLPTVVGIREVTERLMALPAEFGTAEDRDLWKRLREACPQVPMTTDAKSGEKRFGIAEKFDPKRSNCENPELMAVWPFGLSGVGRSMLAEGRATYAARIEKMTHGWTQDGQQAARLGLADEAAANVLAKVRNTHRNFRFPTFWGPNFDWLPDQCHGGNLLTTVQEMLLQSVGDKIIVCPALPKDWSGCFRLCAAKNTTVTAEVRGGVVEWIKVDPPERGKDVEFGEGWVKR